MSYKLVKGGKLIHTDWIYDKESGEGSYVDIDVTERAISLLFEAITLDPDITLKDIFLLLNTNLEGFKHVIGNWVDEIVTEGLTQKEKPYDLSTYDSDQIEYISLSYNVEYDENDNNTLSLYGLNRLNVSGIGVPLKEKQGFYNEGERIPYSISYTPTNELINIPVKFTNKLEVMAGIMQQNPGVTLASFENPEVTLGQILNSIIWDFSFAGSPRSRDKFRADLIKNKETYESEEEN